MQLVLVTRAAMPNMRCSPGCGVRGFLVRQVETRSPRAWREPALGAFWAGWSRHCLSYSFVSGLRTDAAWMQFLSPGKWRMPSRHPGKDEVASLLGQQLHLGAVAGIAVTLDPGRYRVVSLKHA